MAQKPTYEALEKKVRTLEKELSTYKKTENTICNDASTTKALKESQDRYKAIIENSPNGIAVYTSENGQDFIFAEYNNAGATMDKMPREKAIGRNVVDVFPGVIEIGLYDVIRKVWEDGIQRHLPTMHYKNGSLDFWRENFVYKLPSGEIVSIYTDETDKMLAVEELKKSHDLINRSPAVAFIWKNENGWPVEYVSENVQEIFSYSPSELTNGQLFYKDIIYEKDRNKFTEEEKAFSKEKGKIDFLHKPYRIVTRDHKIKWVEDRTFIRRNEKNEITHYEGLIIDITDKIKFERDRNRLETQLNRAQKMETIGTLAGGIAHDFNNILYPIIGYSELSISHLPEKSKVKTFLGEILNAALRARDLVQQILTFSRQAETERKPLMVQPVLKEALRLLRSSIPKNISVKQQIDKKAGVILGDPTEIHQIVMNLCTNAYHAMENEKGILEVTLNEVDFSEVDVPDKSDIEPGRYLCMMVRDTGHGIPHQIIHRIFDPYFTTKENNKGTGLGLSVTLGIVKNHGGAISIKSVPEIGSTFKVYLPLVDKQIVPEGKQPHEIIKTGNERILLVDDEAQIVKMVKSMLKNLGYKVTTLTSSIEALNTFRSTPYAYDIVITDMSMPNLSGDQLSIQILNIRPDIPIILCTGFSERINDDKAMSIGIHSFLLKPIVRNDLAQKVRQALDNKISK